MYIEKKKYFYIFLIIFVLSIIIPFYSFASNDTAFVWSGSSNSSVETVANLTKEKRKYFKFNLWWCYFS